MRLLIAYTYLAFANLIAASVNSYRQQTLLKKERRSLASQGKIEDVHNLLMPRTYEPPDTRTTLRQAAEKLSKISIEEREKVEPRPSGRGKATSPPVPARGSASPGASSSRTSRGARSDRPKGRQPASSHSPGPSSRSTRLERVGSAPKQQPTGGTPKEKGTSQPAAKRRRFEEQLRAANHDLTHVTPLARSGGPPDLTPPPSVSVKERARNLDALLTRPRAPSQSLISDATKKEWELASKELDKGFERSRGPIRGTARRFGSPREPSAASEVASTTDLRRPSANPIPESPFARLAQIPQSFDNDGKTGRGGRRHVDGPLTPSDKKGCIGCTIS